MKGGILGVALAFFAMGCVRARPVTILPPLDEESEVVVYLEPFPQEAEGLTFSLVSFAAVGADGSDVPLQMRLTDLSRQAVESQRMLAWGRIPPGSYEGFKVAVAKARLTRGGQPADLLVSASPTLIAAPFKAVRGKANVVSLAFRFARSVKGSFEFSPEFSAFAPERPPPLLVGYCSDTAGANLTVFDKERRSVAEVLATGGGPRGLALDPSQNRAYVAISAASEVQVIDVTSSQTLARIRLLPGDDPVELAFADNGRLLLVANERSNTLSFVDPLSLAELTRVPTGNEPASLLLDRAGQRAYVFNRGSNNFTVVDVATRAVVATVATDPEPLRGALSRDGTRLYVIHAGSQYMTVFSLPGVTAVSRIFTGLGVSAILVDSRTDYVYVGRSNEKRLSVYDPSSLIPIDTIEVPAPVSYMVIDNVNNTLFALMSESRSVAVVDLTSRRLLAVMDVGDAPYALQLAGQRP